MSRLSPSRLNDFLGCEHRTYLDLQVEQGVISKDEELRPDTEALFERGRRHEADVLQGFHDAGLDVLELPDEGPHGDRADATRKAMAAGRQIIHQACLLHDGWVGFADFLVRVDTPSDLAAFSYEVHDAKLARDAKPSYVFQLLFYNREVTRIQGVAPARMHLILGDGDREAFTPEEFEAYGEHVRAHFAERRAELAGGAEPAYPWPVAQCDFCPFWKRCRDRRRAEDHISLVATLGRGQGRKLEEVGITALGTLATLPADTKVPKLAAETLTGLRLQASLQLASRGLPAPKYELLEPEHGIGLARVPEPSEADLFFDFEGDPYWGEEGLEYLFGTVHREAGEWRYDQRWATSRAEERVALEGWVDWVTERFARHPDLHIYHYNAYEVTALKKLVARHGTREEEFDALLRRKVFVDLYGVVRQALRAGVESYGLKAMEAVHGFERRAHKGSLRGWQTYLETEEPAELDAIAIYNEDDCLSTLALRDWLLDRIPEAEARFGPLDRLESAEVGELSDKAQAFLDALEQCREPLTGDLPDDESADDAEQRARRIMFDLLGYHRRESKPVWWAFFSRLDLGPEQLRDEDNEAIGDLRPVPSAPVDETAKSYIFELAYPEQEQKMGDGAANDEAGNGLSILEHDETERLVRVRRGKKFGQEPPRALIPGGPYKTDAQVEALFRVARRIAAHGLEPRGQHDAALDLLLRRPPRFLPGTPAPTDASLDLETLREQVAALDGSALFIQGPPGSGKTWTGGRLAVDLMRRGKRVGVCATSHKAICNLLRAIEEAADEEKYDFRGWKKASSSGAEGDDHETDRITSSGTQPDDGELKLIAGTAWLWAREDCETCVDVLFVDEAGQVSLADAMAVSTGARSTVLLGDPQQLPHVSQGTHAHGSGVSVLQHLLGDSDTVDPARGVFLDTSWRMHPDVCRFISDTMYDGRLESQTDCSRQLVSSSGLAGTGLRMLSVEHAGNRQRAPEEAECISAEMERLLAGGTFTDRDGVDGPLTLDDILVVAPFNAQVRCLRAALPEGARVGTVDKFQGLEAPVVFFSMTCSSGDDVPRGMDFLFSRNRLNVAVSRAQALAVVVLSPALLRTRCNSVSDMRLINMLCRFAGAAESSPLATRAVS